jgi:ankyrin repeat protein
MATTVLKTRKLNFSKKKRLSSEEEAFRDACGDGNLEEASRHLDKIDIDFCLEHSWTVLMMNLHDLNVATWLLERGADPNYITSDGFTVLYSASRATHREPLIRLLVKHGMRMQLWVVKEEPLNAIRTFGGTEFVVEMFRAGIEIQTSNFSPQKYVIPPIMDNMGNRVFFALIKTHPFLLVL